MTMQSMNVRYERKDCSGSRIPTALIAVGARLLNFGVTERTTKRCLTEYTSGSLGPYRAGTPHAQF